MNQDSQKQAVLDRLDALSGKVTSIHLRISGMLDRALEDAAKLQMSGTGLSFQTLSEDAIVDLTRLKNETAELSEYYATQKAMVLSTLQKQEQQVEVQPVDPAQQAQELARTMRERAAQLAAQPVAPAAAPATEPLGLPVAEPVAEELAKPTLPTLVPIPENSLERLVSRVNSPLLDLFAPGPWLPEGKGNVTVGTYQWYKTVNPLEKNELDRAKLPTGFYGDNGRPTSVLLRLETCIIHWTFGLDFDAMTLFIVGLSNQDPNNLRWFKPQDLSATYTRRLIQELAKEVEKHRVS